MGVHELLLNSILNCDIDVRQQLLNNIVLTGGCTLFPGFAERMQKEINNILPNQHFRVFSFRDRQYSVWIGGSIIASLKQFIDMWISKEEYYETGPLIVHRKCF